MWAFTIFSWMLKKIILKLKIISNNLIWAIILIINSITRSFIILSIKIKNNILTFTLFNFFFSYCNQRVVKFNAKGNKVILEITNNNISTLYCTVLLYFFFIFCAWYKLLYNLLKNDIKSKSMIIFNKRTEYSFLIFCFSSEIIVFKNGRE